jgi:hypothetical protein
MSMKSWGAVFALLLCLQARAAEVVTTVFNVFSSDRSDKIFVLSGADGRVYKTHKSEQNLKYLQSFLGEIVRITYKDAGKEAHIQKVEKVGRNEVDPRVYDLNHFQYNQLRQFAPTDLQSEENVLKVFGNMLNDGDRSRSQCFKRAHMWAYDMWSKLGIYSQKIFIFYTKRYSILEDFDWWFHVAPLVVADGKEYVLDGTFMETPILLNDWKNHFIKSDSITCPVMNHYSEYENNQWTRLCFLMKVPMYHFSPLDIQHRDLQGIKRNHWILEELQDARRAFKGYDKEYEGLDTGKPTIKY